MKIGELFRSIFSFLVSVVALTFETSDEAVRVAFAVVSCMPQFSV